MLSDCECWYECCVLCAVLMAATYISVAEEEGAEPIELPTEEDGTGSQLLSCHLTHNMMTPHNTPAPQCCSPPSLPSSPGPAASSSVTPSPGPGAA